MSWNEGVKEGIVVEDGSIDLDGPNDGWVE